MSESSPLAEDSAPENRPTILAVDDNPINLIALEAILQQDYHLIHAGSGPDALTMVKDKSVDLILLDIAMPEMDGYEVCRRLKQDAASHDIPVIFLTAAESRGMELVGLNVGAIDYLEKPVEESILLARVGNHLELVRARKELKEANDLLDARVRERTVQLDQANLQLKAQIQQHQITLDYLEQTVAELDAANRVKDEFLSTMSHELRTPLNGIIGMTDLAEMVSTDSEQISFLKTAKESAVALKRLINRIMEYVQLDAGKHIAKASPYDLKDLVGQSIANHTPLAHQRVLQLQYDVAADLPTELIGDASLMMSILDELLDNAIAFTESGRVSVFVAVESSPEGSRQVHFTVQDSGCGIAPEDLGKLFEPFRQLDGSATRRHEGIGLGLALTKKRVKLMGGKIRAESAPHRGTCVQFTIPEATA